MRLTPKSLSRRSSGGDPAITNPRDDVRALVRVFVHPLVAVGGFIATLPFTLAWIVIAMLKRDSREESDERAAAAELAITDEQARSGARPPDLGQLTRGTATTAPTPSDEGLEATTR